MAIYPSLTLLPKPKDRKLLYSLVSAGLRYGKKYDDLLYYAAVPHGWRLVLKTEFADSLLFCLCDEIGRALVDIMSSCHFCVMGDCDKEIIFFDKYYFENGIWKKREQNPVIQKFQEVLNCYFSEKSPENYGKLLAVHKHLPVYRELPYPPDFKIEPVSYFEADEFLPAFW
jgi:hypothetical protein